MGIKKILLESDDGLLFSHDNVTIVKHRSGLLQALKAKPYDCVVVEEIESLKIVRELYPAIPVLVVAPIGSIEHAVEAMRLGAVDYKVKPIPIEAIEKAFEKPATPVLNDSHETILAQSSVMQKVLADIAKVAQSTAAVFICGESGTGKEVIAHAIHFQSQRARSPFVKVNCAAIPESLIESEFFGHEKGSFTGAIEKRIGRFEMADRGTLLLDEISEIPLHVQAKLLRVVQEQEFERVGGTKPIQVDVRLIATSNRNMKEMIQQKQFREDLYFRLNVVPIQLPPLRERRDDILGLAGYFLDRFCEENQTGKKRLSKAAEQRLLDYPWPGNIRELANTIERAVVMTLGDVVDTDHLRLDPQAPALLTVPVSKELTLEQMEKRHILEALASYNHNRTRAAKALGISVRTLRNKLKSYESATSFK